MSGPLSVAFGHNLTGEYDAGGGPIEETVYLGNTPVAVLVSAQVGDDYVTSVYYVYADHIDTPRVITRSTDNAIVWRWDMTDPFGAIPPNENPSGTQSFVYNLRFPGQLFDKETNNHYNYFRDYDPQTGRYVQSDPIGLDGGINTYGYVAANPLAAIDPDGLQVIRIPVPGPGPGIIDPVTQQPWASAIDDGDGRSRTREGRSRDSGQSCCSSYTDVYEVGRDTPKHGKSARGNIGAEPTNPQLALANSVPVRGGSRFGRDPSTGELVAFQNHRTDERTCIRYWHGYVVTQKDLNTEQWRAGRDGGFPKWPRKP